MVMDNAKMNAPPDDVIQRAVEWANLSPCVKSKRGVVIYVPESGRVISGGTNRQPPGFGCDGSELCRSSCSKLCEHAEAAAIRALRWSGSGFSLVHIKTKDGSPVPSGGPSCPECSKMILASGLIATVWLLYPFGWRRYSPEAFHEMSLENTGLPLIRSRF